MLLPKTFPVTCHTDYVGKGSTFVAIPGFKEDGAHYIREAIKRGATTIVVGPTTHCQNIPKNINVIQVQHPRKALAQHAAKAFNYPAQKFKIIGVTGTKGKTTITHLINHILEHNGFKTARTGTISNKILNQEEASRLTTQESDVLQAFLHECVKKKVEYVTMEVSSSALDLHRVHGIAFDVAGFTNLAPEHLDLHHTLEEYFEIKKRIFSQVKSTGAIVINTDDQWGKKAFDEIEKKSTQTYIASNLKTQLPTKKNVINETFLISQNSLSGLTIKINNANEELSCPTLFGAHNAHNLHMSYCICKQLGLSDKQIKESLNTFQGIPGRLQKHTLKNGTLGFVDFAHNTSSMQAVLSTLKPLTKHLIVVFGCGGNRDKTKRPEMGKVAAHYADIIILTDDNPRFEDRHHILDDILRGIPEKKNVIVEPDRKKAIEKAATLSKKNSIIALLGKGHENYYFIQGKKIILNDFEEIQKF